SGLWATDGTTGGTWRWPGEIPILAGWTSPSFTAVSGRVFFGAADAVHGAELWALDLPSLETTLRRSDANGDGKVDVSDAVRILEWLFRGGGQPPCLAAADVTGDVRIDLADPVSLLGFLFLGEPPPPAPFFRCGHEAPLGAATLGCEVPLGACLEEASP
ncbi:MAG TPA: dockerin type I repeat-containing protein, partial [Planctomycetota bacterium]|nr:dockerin type I repeat-containing protein [Planctomycetota bacterium]